MGFQSGAPIVVEYYNQHQALTNKQTGSIDLSTFRHSIHTDYLLIHNFEIKLDDQLDISYDEDNNVMTVTGAGTTYPGFHPVLGDAFLYALPDDQIGLFIVTSIQRLSIQRGSYHKISFALHKFAEEDDLTKLNTSINDEAYFDKQKYLTGNTTLLKSPEYISLRDLRQYRDILIEHFFNVFYSKDTQTLMHPPTAQYPNGIYDPYIVEFFHAKVSMLDNRNRPTQLMTEVNNHASSIWFLLTGSFHSSIKALQYKTFVIKHENELWDAGITPLINKPYIYLDDTETLNKKEDLLIIDDEDDTAYVFSAQFYESDTIDTVEDEFEQVMWTAINEGTVDAEDLLETYIKNFRSLDPGKQFYHIPAYIALTDLAIASVT